MSERRVLLAAGGTGGHLFPAEALAHELRARGYGVHLATDERAERMASRFAAQNLHVIRSATIASKHPVALARSALALARGYFEARALIRKLRPVAVVGFGGYPTLAPVLAAVHMGVPTMIHDANAVMGRANRWLAGRVPLVAMGFENVRTGDAGNAVVTGNPVRPEILKAAERPYPARHSREPFNLLVFGGSQGAQFFARIVPEAIAALDPGSRSLLRVVQQARPEDVEAVERFYERQGIPAEVAPFFKDMAARLAGAHLVICRAGASTISELAVVGRPAILVPYPHALDHDQTMNAGALAQAGGASIEVQRDLTVNRLSAMLAMAIADPEKLALVAEKAKKTGKAQAAARLADCVEHVAAGGDAKNFKGFHS